MKTEDVVNQFERTTDEIISLEELKKALGSKKKLNLKYGADVTAPDLHIGHAVNLWMYRSLQELGHKFVFLIGDFTTQIGDPTGKDKTRQILPPEQMAENAEQFIAQVKSIVIDDPEVFEIRRNSEWFSQKTAGDLLQLMSCVTQDRLLSRDMFKRRVENGQAIYQHELVYPIIQGWDSVELEADLTIVGSDQLFNEKMGRFYQEREGQTPQVIITTKITPGIDGKEKQSKSIGNYIGLNHSARDKFGRVMKLPDELILDYFKVYTTVPLSEISKIESGISSDPMSCKLKLAQTIVERYHGASAGKDEYEWFRSTFSKGKVPDDIASISIPESGLSLLELLRQCFAGEDKSNSDLKRLIKQGAVSIDGEALKDAGAVVSLKDESATLKVGKRHWFKLLKAH